MMGRFAAPMLLGGCALFGGILLLEINADDRSSIAPAASVEASDPLPALHPLAIAPAAPPIAAILARPLFSPNRRPPQSAVGNSADDAGLGDSRLAGIVIEPGHRFAIFAPEGAKPLTVTEGETVSGWRVDSISPREVSLSGPDGTKTLQPKFDPNLAPPSEPAPPPMPATATPQANLRAVPGIAMPRPGAPVFIPGQARLRQLRRR
jgi:hypothetical protein